MKTCSNCGEKFPLMKLGFLTIFNNEIQCKACKAIFEADQKQLGITGGLGGLVGGFGGMYIIELDLFNTISDSIFFVILLLVSLFLIVTLIHANTIKLTLVDKQKRTKQD